MTMNPTPEQAQHLLTLTHGAADSLRAAGQNRHAQWLTGFATSTFMTYVGLSTTPDDAGGLVLLGAYMATVAFLSFALRRGAPVTKRGLSGRLVPAMSTWGVLYGITLFVGLEWFRESSLFWLVSAFVVTAPLAVGAWREGRA
ncbi:hypothetical protein [Cellulomonas sp. URHD0024]|uniref:hypothetical protein n=1 Tax=Cellulomonas sp. URHD0024 TaxID=1302620 RepID=UPI00041B4B3F|nr:hypothetical protein [Cellulomonas sp. URHD0024]